MADTAAVATLNTTEIQPKKKSKPAHKSDKPPVETRTIRSLPYTYLHLTLLNSSCTEDPSIKYSPLDAITACRHIFSALNQFLGMTGTAIPVDILKVDGRDCWVRVPRNYGRAVTEALSGWVGENVAWRIRGSSIWLAGLAVGDGRHLFEE